jgi:hypothetical protein
MVARAVFIRDYQNLSLMLESVVIMMLSSRSILYLFVPRKDNEIGPSILFTRLGCLHILAVSKTEDLAKWPQVIRCC